MARFQRNCNVMRSAADAVGAFSCAVLGVLLDAVLASILFVRLALRSLLILCIALLILPDSRPRDRVLA